MTKICIIDDDKTDRFIIERALKSVLDDLTISQAKNEETGHTLVSNTLPDIVIMDVNLVGSSGHALAKRLKKELSSHTFTIVMMSGFVQSKSERYHTKLEQENVIVKPMRISDYPNFVAEIMSAHKKTLANELIAA